MTEGTWVHKKVVIKCMIGSNQSQQNISLSTKGNEADKWSKNIAKIFKKAKNMTKDLNRNEWELSLNGRIIKEHEPQILGDILGAIPTNPPPIISIIQVSSEQKKDEFNEDLKVITVHYNEQQFDIRVPSNTSDWDENLYLNLLDKISDEFGISDFTIYEIVEGDDCFIDDVDDLSTNFEEYEEDDDPTNSMHIHVKNNFTPGFTGHETDEVDDEEEEEDDLKQTEDSIKEMLYNLGGSIACLDDEQKKNAYQELENIIDEIMQNGQDLTAQYTSILQRDAKTSPEYAQCVASFLDIIGYTIEYNNEYILSGAPNKPLLADIASKFYHIAEGMQNPPQNIYQQLNITIPGTEKVIKHQSGINDNEYIIFELWQIVLEKQQTSLVSKTILNPNNVERFINFLKPGSSKNSCKDIYFNKLKKLKITTIGLFGSREEILSMLQKYETISKSLYNVLINDDNHKYISSGVHAILPINLHQNANNKDNNPKLSKSKLNHIIYLFYWPLPRSFDLESKNIQIDKKIKRMKKDPSCLLSRVLHELSSTVCICVDSKELNDFGPIKRNTQRIRTYDLNYKKTKQSEFSLAKQSTNIKKLPNYEAIYKSNADNMFLINGDNLRCYAQTFHQKAKVEDVTFTVRSENENALNIIFV